jgi:hypothetical protein
MSELPETLIYYGSYQGVLKILKQQSLPLFEANELQDPFLPSKYSQLSFDCQALFESTIKTMASAILGKEPPKGNPYHPLQKAIRRWRGENRFNDESEIRTSLVFLLPAMVEQTFNQAKESHQQWQSFVEKIRLLPFFENVYDHELWSLEGNRHSGVAIKFKCVKDSIFESCLPINYSRQPANVVDINDYIDFMIGEKQDIKTDFKRLLLTQNFVYKHQKEWRLILERNNQEDCYLGFPIELIQGIYIGAAVSKKDTEKLVKMIKQVNKDSNLEKPIKINVAVCSNKSYEFHFEKH